MSWRTSTTLILAGGLGASLGLMHSQMSSSREDIIQDRGVRIGELLATKHELFVCRTQSVLAVGDDCRVPEQAEIRAHERAQEALNENHPHVPFDRWQQMIRQRLFKLIRVLGSD